MSRPGKLLPEASVRGKNTPTPRLEARDLFASNPLIIERK